MATVFNHVMFKRTLISIHVETDKKLLHILDEDADGFMTLTNAVSDEYLKSLAREVLLLPKADCERLFNDYTVLLYATDGYISEWVGDFRHVDLKDPRPYPKYTWLMKTRRLLDE